MQTEHEAKFLGINKDEVRARLQSAGAVCTTPDRLMRRTIMDFPDRRLYHVDGKRNWVRIRDEGDKVTLTFKQVQEHAVAGSLEQEVTVSDYETTIGIMNSIGLKKISCQETRRETWHLGDVMVTIDEWPFIPPFIEVEGPDQVAIQAVAETLGFTWSDARFGSANIVYQLHYPKMRDDETVDMMGDLVFANELPVWLKERQ